MINDQISMIFFGAVRFSLPSSPLLSIGQENSEELFE